MSDYPMTSASGLRMLGCLPEYYKSSRVIKTISQVRGEEVDKLRQALDETLEQFYINTSTWSLDDWEEELGLPLAPEQPESQRRPKIKSRIRGKGTCTIKIAKEVAESYENGTVEVVENHPQYLVLIIFVDVFGIPPNMNDLMAALRAVVPAHLSIQYQYRWTLYGDIKTWGLTYGDLKTLTYGGIKTYKPS
ncbi:putative phage tail protein [Pelotomaculum propionicicum]|uniref:putative phage tail protein n=1 Tax=Pelotomaculum propionicicum TaxID=258475 RepID=UPI003B7C6B30